MPHGNELRNYSIQCILLFMTLAGVPTAIQLGGIFFVTIEFIPTTAPFPILTPFITTQEAPNQT